MLSRKSAQSLWEYHQRVSPTRSLGTINTLSAKPTLLPHLLLAPCAHALALLQQALVERRHTQKSQWWVGGEEITNLSYSTTF